MAFGWTQRLTFHQDAVLSVGALYYCLATMISAARFIVSTAAPTLRSRITRLHRSKKRFVSYEHVYFDFGHLNRSGFLWFLKRESTFFLTAVGWNPTVFQDDFYLIGNNSSINLINQFFSIDGVVYPKYKKSAFFLYFGSFKRTPLFRSCANYKLLY